jgi:hypothetical protein
LLAGHHHAGRRIRQLAGELVGRRVAVAAVGHRQLRGELAAGSGAGGAGRPLAAGDEPQRGEQIVIAPGQESGRQRGEQPVGRQVDPQRLRPVGPVRPA